VWQVWQNLTEGQGTVVASMLTMLAAVTGVVLGSILFGKRVSDLRAAVDETEQTLQLHRDHVSTVLKEIGDRIIGLDDQVASTLPKLGALQNALDERAEEAANATGNALSPRERIKDLWASIKDDLEQRAADLDIDGRTRAAYARVDRRQYWALIERLESDGILGTKEAAGFHKALELWQRFKTGRAIPQTSDALQMETVAKQLGLQT
jgi:uncharacterized phage infection (PIP) family protein YhgE